MATAHLSYERTALPRTGTADGVCVGSAMLGATAGALGGVVAVAGSGFEYAPVLVGTLGVIVGSVVAGTVGRYLVFPAWAALSRGNHRD
jgi:hypothetical protein